ncbi:hypothetical protein F0U62_39535 [Cystobacter fuscus]|uniref:hypothetical protein n=1 Tax=Cystobacter fuscus TaxID=43 RepID=UPI002B29ABB6|nr:hypothetical protein F0U62_39535 [Cystobacter fuscus]
MRPSRLPLALTVFLSSCALFHPAAPRSPEDPSIQFPSFHERFATPVGGEGQTYELDGVTLRALSIAARDFLPSGGAQASCADKPEALRYRFIRQGEIIFVQISLNSAVCEHAILDGGVKYAIHTDGRILRRLFDGEPEALPPESDPAQVPPSAAAPVPTSQVGSTSAPPAAGLPASWFDGGTPDAGSPGADGGVQTPDAG